MSNIPSAAEYVQLEAVLTRRPTSESLLQGMGGSINYLLDIASGLGLTIVQFTANSTWTCPANKNNVILLGCGGGSSGISSLGGGLSIYGGLGAQLGFAIIPVTPTTVYNVDIGAGGAGSSTDGNAGGNTVFRLGATVLRQFNGAPKTIPPFGSSLDVFYTNFLSTQNGASSYGWPGGLLQGGAAGGMAGPFGQGGYGGSPVVPPVAPPANSGAGSGAGNGIASLSAADGTLYLLYV